MKMHSPCIYVAFICFYTCGVTMATNVSLVKNIINAITSNMNEEMERSSTFDQFGKKYFVGKLTKTNVFNTTDNLEACLSPVNISACQHYLQTNCVQIETLLKNSIQEHINITEYLPAILHQLDSPACSTEDDGQHHSKEKLKNSYAKVWGYSIGYGCLICFVVSNVGGLLAPFMKKDFFQKIMLFCVALAVGTLASVGLLVLVPESMSLTGENSPVPNYHFKMATVIAGIFFFYITEKCVKMYFSRPKKIKKDMELSSVVIKAKTENKERGHSHFPGLLENNDEKNSDHINENAQDGETKPVEVSYRRSKHLSTMALMILVGDGLHKLVDGISIGAAFTESTTLGFSISLAVICEELPHELGDIAILLHSGLSMRRSLLYNCLAATTCFVGLAIGILLGENTNANSWIFSIAGGMFSYIALVDVLPEMADQARHMEDRGIENKWTAMFIQCIGLITGFIIILMLAIYGGNIKM